MRTFLLGAWLGLCLAFWSCTLPAESHHNGPKLPIIPNTPAIASIWDDGEVTYAFDTRAANYPSFVAQAEQVLENHYWNIGVRTRRVEMSESPDIINVMPNTFGCGAGAAACVTYASRPVVVQYNYRLGYSDWKSAVSHEHGHVWGLHEQYQDTGSIQCLNRPWTIMSCGFSQVWQMQDFDWINIKSWLAPPAIGWTGEEVGEQPNGQRYVWFGGVDSNSGRTDRIAINYLDPNGAFYWSGFYLPVRDSGALVWCVPGRHIYLNQENAEWPESYSFWWLRSDTWAGTC